MSRATKIAALLLLVWVALAAYWLQSVQQVARTEVDHTEERARREVTQPPTDDSGAEPAKATLYRLAAGGTTLEPVETELPLSTDPSLRARQLIHALVALEPQGNQRALPPDTTLLEFYVLPEGAAVADFSGVLATALPSGILSEHLAVEAIARTLADNIPELRRLKIVIAGREVETLAGHVDLSAFFLLRAPATQPTPAESTARLEPPQ